MNNIQQLSTDWGFVTIMGVVTMALFGYYLYSLKKKHPEANSGELISDIYLNNKETVFIFGTLFVNFAEAMLASSIHPPGQMAPNSFARFLTHGTVAFVAIGAAMYFPGYLRAFIETFRTVKFKEGWFKYLGRFIALLLAFTGMVGLPLLNLFIIANGTGQVMQTSILIYDCLPWISDQQMVSIYRSWGQADNYSSFSNIHYVMSASFGMTIAHFYLMAQHSAVIMEGKRKSYSFLNQDETDDMITKKSNKKKEQDLSRFESVIKFLLKRVKYKDEELGEAIKEAEKRLGGAPEAKRADIAEIAAEITNSSVAVPLKEQDLVCH